MNVPTVIQHWSSGNVDAARNAASMGGAPAVTAYNLLARGVPVATVLAGAQRAGLAGGMAGAPGGVWAGVGPSSIPGSIGAIAGGGPLPGPLRPANVTAACGVGPTGAALPNRRPFSFPMRIQLAASSYATGTQTDFVATAACDAISTAKRFPNSFISETAKLIVGAQVPASIVETLGVILGLYITEYHAGQEVARYPIASLAPVIGYSSLTTSGAAAAVSAYNIPGVKFQQAWDPNTDYDLYLQTTKTFTPAAVLDFTLILDGTIVA